MTRPTLVVALVSVLALSLVSAVSAASTSTLRHRELRQRSTIWADRGTVRFFARRPWLARTPAGRRALRFARAELAWTRRELAETRAALRPPAPTSASISAVASWYGPGFYGNRTACGMTLTTALLGVANRTLACGTPLTICYSGRCVRASVVDRGPYVAGRTFDLTGGLAVALGFGGVGTVTYSLG